MAAPQSTEAIFVEIYS